MNVLHDLAELDALLEGREDISDNGGPNTAMMVRQVLATALPAIASLIESEDIARGMVDASWMDRARQAEKQLAAAREALQAAEADAARYRYIRDTPWYGTELGKIISMQSNALWDSAIDSARSTYSETASHE